MDLTELMRTSAVETIRHCCHPWGIEASGRSVGHHQVWARDSMIASLGARLVDDAGIHTALRASVALLKHHQAATGAIPNNVDGPTLRPNFRAYADSGLWWIIGSAVLDSDPAAIRAVLDWYECQDVDQSGLLSMQEGSDWQDLFCTRGKGLYLNCLYVLALRSAASLFARSDAGRSELYRVRAQTVADVINTWFWYAGDENLIRHLSHSFSTEAQGELDSLGRKRWIPGKRYLAEESYYLPYLGFRAVGEWFDSLGNLLAILAGVADERRSAIILDLISRCGLDTWPVRSLTPVIRPGDRDWRDYYGTLNTPYHYHNGGVWPFIGGFYVAALVAAGRPAEAWVALTKLAELNQLGEFNEWHHGETGEPMGVKDQAWSAGMYLFAHDCVRRSRVEIGPKA